ncbi:phage antirepressor KilAC domain-containing protein [Corallococcus sp. AS-1-6]|uniref:phage antirepressor KilAC domain-containing protein n=1 Tax=Corallococcus sp. AS-1-6 TaxID=2874599 RepID=UPI001CBF2AAB|nr:phage antirepressor KilAC domain-containing protein [Corallococcus sp. AS-1-6]MBZ4371495.1 phage antirepressor KilAC domain-containing protein [Corallococcus sp. AS-1-6]
MSCQPSSIQVAGVVITQDAHGRFSLNDLHLAAGGEARHQPSNFLRLGSTRALAAELGNSSEVRSSPVEVVTGRNGGTFACHELVIAYAAWVSPPFHVAVIQTFIAVATGNAPQPPAPAFAVPKSLPEALRLAADLAEKVESQQAQLLAQQPAVDFVDRYAKADSLLSLRDAAKRLCIPPLTLNARLVEDGILFRRRDKKLEPYAEYVARGLFAFPPNLVTLHTAAGSVEKDFSQTRVTPAGVVWLGERYAELAASLAH